MDSEILPHFDFVAARDIQMCFTNKGLVCVLMEYVLHVSMISSDHIPRRGGVEVAGWTVNRMISITSPHVSPLMARR